MENEIAVHKKRTAAAELAAQKSQNELRRIEMDHETDLVDVARFKKQCVMLQEQLNVAVQKNHHLSTGKAEADASLSALTQQLKLATTSVPELTDRLKFAEQANKTLQTQFDTLWSSKRDLEKQLEVAQKTGAGVAAGEGEVARLKQEVNRLQTENTVLTTAKLYVPCCVFWNVCLCLSS